MAANTPRAWATRCSTSVYAFLPISGPVTGQPQLKAAAIWNRRAWPLRCLLLHRGCQRTLREDDGGGRASKRAGSDATATSYRKCIPETKPRAEHIHRMNFWLADALAVGVPMSHIDNVVRDLSCQRAFRKSWIGLANRWRTPRTH
ncbi:unnamed protein product [Peniophora sp. CBMAI 1063]|nr:unnamed protein product [Peniophora sp. CBMAI 1063]